MKNKIFYTVAMLIVLANIHNGCSKGKDIILQEQIHINEAQKTVSISLTNISENSVSFYSYLDEKTSEPMGVPSYVHIRAKDKKGSIITSNDIIEDGWYSPRLYSSQQKIDLSETGLINLLPGETYTRIYSISSFLWSPQGFIELSDVDQIQFKIVAGPHLYSFTREVDDGAYAGDVVITEWTPFRFN